MAKPKEAYAVDSLYVLFDSDGEYVDTFGAILEAKGCAWGRRFADGYTIIRYKLEKTLVYESYGES